MATTRYSIHSALFNSSGLTIAQMGSQSFDPGQTLDEIIPGGALDRGAVIVGSTNPMVSLSTRNLTTVFGTVSPTVGYNCTGSSVFYYQQRASGGGFTGGSTFITVTAAKGFLQPMRLSASSGGTQAANLDLTFHALFDGTNIPLVQAGSAASGAAPGFTSAFYLGPVYVNSGQLEGVTSTDVDFGIQFDKIWPDGNIHPTSGSITSRTPVFSATFLRQEMIDSTIASFFSAVAAGTIAFYYYKGANGSGRVASATTEHCKVSATAGVLTPDRCSVTGNEDGTVTVTARPTTAIAISVASAVP